MEGRRVYSMRLTEEEVRRFIEARIKYDDLFRGKVYDAANAWNKVGTESGIEYGDWRKLKKRWNNLLWKYKSVIDQPIGTGTEDDGPPSLTWPHFDILHEYCASRHNIKPPLVINSEDVSACSPPSPQMIVPNVLASSTDSEGSLSKPNPNSGRRKAPKRSIWNAEDEEEKKTQKLMRKSARVFLKFMQSQFGIYPESSDSD